MNSLVFDIRRYTIHDGPGIRTTIFFKGCPLRCWWCHNPESQETGIENVAIQRILDGKLFETNSTIGSWKTAGEVMGEIDRDAVFYNESGGGVTFSGGEPLMQPDALQELISLCKEKGYHTAVDTCGHAEPAALKKVMALADLWLFDLKIMNDTRHVEYTGVSNELALKNLETLAIAGKDVNVRFPLVPGITDDNGNLEKIAGLMRKLGLKRIDVLPYHSIARDKYRRIGKKFLLEGLNEPDHERVEHVSGYFRGAGLEVGNGSL